MSVQAKEPDAVSWSNIALTLKSIPDKRTKELMKYKI